MNFSKDLVLKSDGRNSVFPKRVFFLNLLVVLLGRHDALTYADACSHLGHPSESLRWTTLHGIRRFFKKQKQIDLAHEVLILIVSAMQVCV